MSQEDRRSLVREIRTRLIKGCVAQFFFLQSRGSSPYNWLESFSHFFVTVQMIQTCWKCWNSSNEHMVRWSGNTAAMELKLMSTDCYFNCVKPLRKESDSKFSYKWWNSSKQALQPDKRHSMSADTQDNSTGTFHFMYHSTLKVLSHIDTKIQVGLWRNLTELHRQRPHGVTVSNVARCVCVQMSVNMIGSCREMWTAAKLNRSQLQKTKKDWLWNSK